MHTRRLNDNTNVNFNSDLSGDMYIDGVCEDTGNIERIKINADDFIDFIFTQKLGVSIIEDIDNMSGLELITKIINISSCIHKCPEIKIWKDKTREVLTKYVPSSYIDEALNEIFTKLCG